VTAAKTARRDRPRAAGKLRIGDDWNAIRIIALSQSNPLKAIAEFVENSIDAHAAAIVITRGREQGAHYLSIKDDGDGVPRDDEGLPNFKYVATHICDSIKRQLKTGRVALLFGSERYGLSNEELSHCHWVMRIPTREEHRSMNLGQAVAVSLYELVRGRKAASAKSTAAKKDKISAKSADVERLTQVLFQVLRVSGYIEPRAVAAEEKLRRLVRRLQLNADDAAVLVGMLRQTAWKINAGEKPGK